MSEQYPEIQNALRFVAAEYLFEYANSETHNNLSKDLTEYCEELREAGGCTDYAVICDDTNNTEERTGRGELWADVALQFVEGGEFFYFPIRVSGSDVQG